MYRVDTKCILLNLLHKNKEVSTENLINFKLSINEPDIYFDLSDDTVCFTVERNPGIFEWNGDNVRLSNTLKSEYFDLLRNAVNGLLPENVKKIFDYFVLK